MALLPLHHLGTLVGRVVIADQLDLLAIRRGAATQVEEFDPLLSRCLVMHLPMTSPLATLSAANSEVVPLHL